MAYKVHFISFKNMEQANAFNTLHGNGDNLQAWHIPLLEEFIEQAKDQISEQGKDSDEDFDDLC